MKRYLALLLCLCLLPLSVLAEDAPQPIYKALVTTDTRIRTEKDRTSNRLALVEEDHPIYIYEWHEDWCLCGVEGDDRLGWVQTERLYELWQLTDQPLPNYVFMTGVAEITQDVHVQTENYSGNDLKPGYIVALQQEDGTLPMRRYDAQLPEGSYTYRPFVKPEESVPGDLLYAFTTYYNDRAVGTMARQREQNVMLAVERVNGTVLAPGEDFSYNALCGPYYVNNGYVRAPNISQSGTGVGGGVCQVSTTIFDAVLGLNLKIKDWEVHQVMGVFYTPQNLDCSVSNSQDFVFTNTLNIPLELRLMTQEGALTVLLLHGE